MPIKGARLGTPWRLMWDTTAILSILMMTWKCARNRRKWMRARWTALNSRLFMCQVRYLPDQTPQAGLPSKTAPHPEREASVIVIWRRQTTPISTPLRRKLGSRHTKRVQRQASDTLSRQRDGQEGWIPRDSIHQRNAPREEPGKPQPWGKGACDTGPLTRDDLAWSGLSTIGCSRPTSSLTSYTISRSLSHVIHLRFWARIA